ncbi:helix-turn-helix transcriptional regulator [Lichenihabitans sp. Uapishka_5]|uniref:helix-turn-helix transcriptional regulator n=1 Tax=Lichenihabitans sp. Uapishka_5 TaxID=3037302 RepID=UPI0029E821D7|nr:helix-turn-helix transcriptional regulator [Lichenihabitans sp. Uapishka_5]MDX7952670.1 helix-turn-helix transcriptional regulator [Lichenihabitans sp. Uapishka_5]
MEDQAPIIDLIYEAAALPERWPAALQAVATHIGGFSGILFTAGQGKAKWLCSADNRDDFGRWVDDGWLGRNSRLPRTLALGSQHSVVTDLDIFTADEMAADPLYQLLRTHRWGWFAGMAPTAPVGSETIALSFERAFAEGPYAQAQVARLAALRPHLLRALLLGTRLGLERHVAATEVLERLGLPAAVLGQGGRLLAANASFEAAMPDLMRHGRDRLQLADTAADARLSATLRGIAAGRVGTTPLTLVLGRRPGQAATLLHLLPTRGAAHDVFAGALALCVLTPPQGRPLPEAAVLGQMFELSPREAALTLGIGRGDTLKTYAEEAGVTANTAKAQLKHVFEKTGVRRQAELVALLARLSGP